MGNKITTWIDAETAEIEILDGPAIGKYQILVGGDHSGKIQLGHAIIDGKDTIVSTMVDGITGYAEHLAAYRAKLQAEIDANRQCNRCEVHVDKTAYHQMEWFRAGGLKAKVPTYYCDKCARLLRSIGAGEHTEMEDRAASVSSYEPSYKGDE